MSGGARSPSSARRRFAARMPRVALRFTVAWLVVVVALAPLLIVLGWLKVEQKVEAQMRRNAAFSAREAALVMTSQTRAPGAPATGSLPAVGSPTGVVAPRAANAGAPDAASARAAQLEGVARVHRVRLRVFDAGGRLLEDFDFDYGQDLSQRAGGVVLRPNVERASLAFDKSFGAVARRPEFVNALQAGRSSPAEPVEGCRDLAERDLVVCHAVKRVLDGGAVRVTLVLELRKLEAPTRVIAPLACISILVLGLALLQLIALATPILPIATIFGRGIDGMVLP